MKNKIKNNEFLKRLFDFSFKKFVTTKVIKFIFWANVAIAAILALLTVIGGFKESVALGILAFIFAPIFYIVYIAILKIILEIIAVLFRIGEYVEDISKSVSGIKKIDEYEVKEEEE